MTQKPIKATLDSSDDAVKTQKPILIQLDDIPTPEVGDAGKVLGVDEEGKFALKNDGLNYEKLDGTYDDNTNTIYCLVKDGFTSIDDADAYIKNYVDEHILIEISTYMTFFGAFDIMVYRTVNGYYSIANIAGQLYVIRVQTTVSSTECGLTASLITLATA